MMDNLQARVNKNKTLLIIISLIFLFVSIGWLLYTHFGYELIRAMYEGRSIGILNRIIEKQAIHPVERYFERADSLFFVLNIGVFTALTYLFLIVADVHINLVISISSFIGMMFAFICTSRYGVGISPDSVSYIAAAKSLLSGNGFLNYTGAPLTHFPPLFPVILAIFGLMGVDPLNGARFFNAIIFGLIIFASGQLFRASIRSKKLVILGLISILLSISLLKTSVMAWTEPLFILLVVLFIICLTKFLSEKQWSILGLLSIIAAFSCIQRYIGVTLVFTGFVSIFFLLPKVPFLQKLKYGIVFCFISVTPCFIWIVRNYILTKTFFGYRVPSHHSLSHYIYRTFDIVTRWAVPRKIPLLMRMIGAVLIVQIMINVVFFLRSKRNRQVNNELIQIFPAGIFMLIYIICLINFAVSGINDRLLSPIYVFVIFLILVGVENISNLSGQFRRNKRAVNYIVIVLFALWLVYSFICVAEQTSDWISTGAGGYNTVEWRESPLIEWLQAHPLDGAIYSNSPEAVYILTGKRTKKLAPIIAHTNNEGDNLQQFKESLKLNKRTYFVWFEKAKGPYLYSLRGLRPVFVLERVAAFSDGVVDLYRQED